APADSPAGHHLDVADLAREVGGAAVQLAADDDPGAHAGADEHEQHVAHAARRAKARFAEGDRVQIVVQLGALADARAQQRAEVALGPAEVRSVHHHTGPAAQHAGEADPDAAALVLGIDGAHHRLH